MIVTIVTVGAGGEVLTANVSNPGFIVGTEEPPDEPQDAIHTSGSGTGASFNIVWDTDRHTRGVHRNDRRWRQPGRCWRNLGLQSVARP